MLKGVHMGLVVLMSISMFAGAISILNITEDAEACNFGTELIAGQNEIAGTVQFIHYSWASEMMCLEVEMEEGWYMTEWHLAVGEGLTKDKNEYDTHIPLTKSGAPKVGNFQYSGEFSTPLNSDDGQVLVQDFNLFDIGTIEKDYRENGDIIPKGRFYAAFHAVVYKLNSDSSMREETAWADTTGHNYEKGWGFYLIYNIDYYNDPQAWAS